MNSFACIFADGSIPNPNFEILDAAVVVIALFCEGGCTWQSLQGALGAIDQGLAKANETLLEQNFVFELLDELFQFHGVLEPLEPSEFLS